MKQGGKVFGVVCNNNADQIINLYRDTIIMMLWTGHIGEEWRQKNNNSQTESYGLDDDNIFYVGTYIENGIEYNPITFYPEKFGKEIDLSQYKVAKVKIPFYDISSYWFDDDGFLTEQSVYHHYIKNAQWMEITNPFFCF